MAVSITAVRVSGTSISMLRTSSGDQTRATVVASIKSGLEYRTAPSSGFGAKVHVVKHPTGEFISTDPNEKKGDNLGNLPTF